MDSTNSQPNMRHPSFPGPWPPCPRYPPRPCGFPIDHRFYPPPMPPFQRPHFQCPPSSNQLNPRLFPEMNVFHHPYQMPGIFPPRPPDLQNNGTHHILHQAGSMPSGMPPYGPQHQPRGNFSRVSDSRVYSEGHGDPANHQMYCHYPNLPVKSESNSDYDNLKSSMTSHSQLPINPKKDNHSIHELMTDKTSIHQEQQLLNTNYEHASHFIQTKEYYNEPYKHSESKRREGLSSSKDYERCKKKSSHKRSVTSDRKRSSRSPEISKDDRKKLSKPSDERKRKEDPSHIRKTCKSSNRKEKCRNSSEEKEQSIGHSHERTRNCSKERRRRRSSSREKKSRNPSNEQRQSRNPHSERKQSRNHSLDRRKSRNSSKEKRHSKNYSSERKSIKNRSSERMHSRIRGSECKKPKNLNAEGKNLKDPAKEKRTVHNDEESSKIKTAKNDNCEKGNSSNEGEILKATNLKRESCDVNYENKTIQLGNESKKLRTESNEKRKLNSSERENIGKTIKKSSKCHKHSSHTQKKRHCPHSDQLHHRKCRSKAHDRQVTNDHKLEKEDNHSMVKSMETGKETSDIDEVNPSTNVCTWIRSSPAELYYIRDENNPKVMTASHKLIELHQNFDSELVKRAERVKLSKPKYEPPHRKTKLRKPKPPKLENEESSSTSEESSSEEEDTSLEELERKKKHPYRLHEELWYNDPGEMNDGPLCRCSAKARRSGIRHGIYAGESSISLCDLYGNNADKLHHYRIEITPTTNFLSKTPTTIHHDGHDFRFEGFSILSHFEIPELPNCKVIRFNIEYTIYYVKEKFPENFTIAGLELFSRYLFTEVLELVDLNWKAHDDSRGCPRFHFLPRFARDIEANGKELLSLNVILQYLLDSNQLLIESQNLPHIMSLSKHRWQDLADNVKGMIVTCPGMKPSSIRVDQLDRELCDPKENICPEIVHFGVRPPQLSYAGNPNYQKAWRDYVKFRHLLANKPKVIYADRHRLLHKERRLQEMRMKNNLKRDVTVVISSEKFYKTGIMCDVVQHGMLLPVLICHLRFHQSLDVLEDRIGYKFKDRYLLQLALTHPSYRENFGTNPDHARNSLTNCGIRQPEYGDRRIHYMNTRKRGINTLINIMSRFGRREETASRINHNERLEFLGDAVVEFLSSIHLFFMFSNLEEGGLATYRAAIVQNQHLAVLAKNLQLEKFMLYAHGSDLCHDLELRHAMANCFEALMGALFLDGGIDVADRVFSETLFSGIYLEEWANYPSHPLQELEPRGDRKWIPLVPILQNLSKFEESTGIEFTHIRLLARAMTHRSLGYNNLTMGSNQRLEFLGDTVLQLVASEYLYKYFPEHHEGHLSLLRSSLVNNRTQAVVCDDLGMVEYAIYPYSKVELKAKDRADLLEAFLGALYVDKGLGYCTKFCEVCFFPRLQDFIMNQEWNDPKSKLQQCCLTLRTMDGGEPDIPVYKVIECKGPTNTRVYSVAVYFRRRRLAVGTGHSIQQAEMSAAENALYTSKDLFPQLDHQRRAIEKSLNQRKPSKREYRK